MDAARRRHPSMPPRLHNSTLSRGRRGCRYKKTQGRCVSVRAIQKRRSVTTAAVVMSNSQGCVWEAFPLLFIAFWAFAVHQCDPFVRRHLATSCYRHRYCRWVSEDLAHQRLELAWFGVLHRVCAFPVSASLVLVLHHYQVAVVLHCACIHWFINPSCRSPARRRVGSVPPVWGLARLGFSNAPSVNGRRRRRVAIGATEGSGNP